MQGPAGVGGVEEEGGESEGVWGIVRRGDSKVDLHGRRGWPGLLSASEGHVKCTKSCPCSAGHRRI
jgi:hypothetical protein